MTPEPDDRPESLDDALRPALDLDAEVAALIEQEDACLTSLELAERLPPPSLDDFLS
jgi:hypothetical protein